MFKFLRKYSNWILAVGGTLLLVTFLVPQAIQGLSQYSAVTGGTWASVGTSGEKITLGEYDFIQRQTRLIDLLGPQNPINQLGAGSNPAHWYLLVREAKAAGLIPGATSGITLAEAMAQNSGDGVTAQSVIQNLGARSGLSPKQTIETLAEIVGVNRLMQLVAGAGRISDLRMRSVAARKTLGVAADLVVIDAKSNTSIQAPNHEEAKYAEQLSTHAEAPSGSGERGFGYRIPDRFKIEWLFIPKSAIEVSVLNTKALDSVELRKAFLRNPAKFGAIANLSTSSSGPSFQEYRERVRTQVLSEEIAKQTKNVAKFASDQLQFPRRGLDTDGIHVVLSDDWASRRLSLTELATKIREQFGIELPAYASSGQDWLEGSDLADEKFGDLATASTDRFGTTSMQTPQVIEAIKEFGGNETVPVQANLALPPLKTSGGDLFIARIIDTDPSHPPADIAEVREEVKKDLDAIFRFESLNEQMPEIMKTARTDGLRTVANAFDVPVEFASNIREADLNLLVQYGVTISGSIPGVGTNTDAITKIVEKASKLDPKTPITEQPIEDRIFSVALPDILKVIIVKVDRLSPLTSEQWTSLTSAGPGLQQAVAQDLAPSDPAKLFDFDALKTRHIFEPSRSNSDDDEETADADADADADAT